MFILQSVVYYSVIKHSHNCLQAISKLLDTIKSKGAPHSGKIEEVRNKNFLINI
jgi:hypothetical protein